MEKDKIHPKHSKENLPHEHHGHHEHHQMSQPYTIGSFLFLFLVAYLSSFIAPIRFWNG